MKRGVLVIVVSLLLLVPTLAWAKPPVGVGAPIDADTVDGYHATSIIDPLQANIDAEADVRSAGDTDLQSQISGLETRLAAVEAYESRIAALETELAGAWDLIAELESSILALDPNGELAELANHVTVADSTINSLAGPHIIFSGVNVHIQDGSGQPNMMDSGLGNLIVGYNLDSDSTGSVYNREGSHNLIVGDMHQYNGHNGFIAGYRNTIKTNYSSISGGSNNRVYGNFSSVTGGENNQAEHSNNTINGGVNNHVTGWYNSISGGANNSVGRNYASNISGGWFNYIGGDYCSISGGTYNETRGDSSSISGGRNNYIEYDTHYATISGGSYQSVFASDIHIP